MREILFRGKRMEDGKWIEGYLVHVNDKYFISDVDATFGMNGEIFDCHCVDPDTVGQYTGLKDKNGKKIFEGDVFEHGASIIHGPDRYKIQYIDGAFCHKNITRRHHCWTAFADEEFGLEGRWCTVIGNIHDNPELLEVK